MTVVRLRWDGADAIEEGRLVEDGTHDALLRAGGRYAQLWRLQSREPEPALRGSGGLSAMAGQVVPLLPRPRGAAERAFLSAALEIVEPLASPTLRLTAGLIVPFLSTALVWSYVGKVDIIAMAPGKVVVRGGTKVIQPSDTGVVHAIQVADGDRVEKGQVLIELDPTISTADKTRYTDQLAQARLDQARLKALLAPGAADPFAAVSAPSDLLAAARARLEAEGREQTAKLAKIAPSTTPSCLWSRGEPTFTGRF